MNFSGIIIGGASFLIIGIFHPLVIKGEYHFSKSIWPIFLAAGIIFIVVSLFINDHILSPLLGVTGFSSLWSIGELFHQEQRVMKGWFPRNPKRDK